MLDLGLLAQLASPIMKPLEPVLAETPRWLEELDLLDPTVYTVPVDKATRSRADELSVLCALGGLARLTRDIVSALKDVDLPHIDEVVDRGEAIYRVLYLATDVLTSRLMSDEPPSPVASTATAHTSSPRTGEELTSNDLEGLD
jgi:hypothetical protein